MIADDGKVFILTEKGYKATPDKIKFQRKIGKPLKGYEDKVPNSWVENGWVRQEVIYNEQCK